MTKYDDKIKVGNIMKWTDPEFDIEHELEIIEVTDDLVTFRDHNFAEDEPLGIATYKRKLIEFAMQKMEEQDE